MILCETARLRLRHLCYADAPFLLRLLNDPAFLRHIGDKGVRTLDDARAYLDNGPLGGYASHGFHLNCVECARTGTPMGICGVLQRETLPCPDLGYAFLPEYRGQGYALEAATAALQHAREQLRLTRILAITSLDNESSMRLLGKLGFAAQEETLRLPAQGGEVRLFAWSC